MNPIKHVAIIMDGNGRWGMKHKNSRNAGHRAGLNPVQSIIDHCIKKEIKYLTLYTFSTENWKRPKSEINFLFKLFQLNLRYKENRSDYGIEIFEYFYLPWRADPEFNNYYNIVSDYTLNPKSRLFTLYDYSKRYLDDDTTFIEVGCWNGGASALVALANKNKGPPRIAVHCVAGLGRAPLLVALALVHKGCSQINAVELTRKERPGSLNLYQADFILHYKPKAEQDNKNATCQCNIF